MPSLNYDPEWLSILEESEPFMNFNNEYWNIPKEFYKNNPESVQNFKTKLSEIGKNIKCPEIFNGNEIEQTKIFKHFFLNNYLKDGAKESNPDEIEIEFC